MTTSDVLDQPDTPVPPGLGDGPIYLDYNSTTPVDPRVAEAMLPYLTEHFGNPSSGHHYAGHPLQALADARGRLAALIGAAQEEIVFTGSGSEADALAIIGTALTHRDPGQVHVVTQATENRSSRPPTRSPPPSGSSRTPRPHGDPTQRRRRAGDHRRR